MFWLTLLPLLAVCCFSFPVGYVQKRRKCYGSDVEIPANINLPMVRKLFFTPTNPSGPRKLIMANKEVKDPRYTVSHIGSAAYLSACDVTERDDGIYSSSSFDHPPELDNWMVMNLFELQVEDCSELINKNYGDTYSFSLPKEADFLEFTPLHSLDQPQILWNRTDPQASSGGRGQLDNNLWTMKEVTQADNGYYNLRRNDSKLLTRKKLTVTEKTESYERLVDEELSIQFPLDTALCTVTFIPSSAKKPRELIKAGRRSVDDHVFAERIQMKSPSFTSSLDFTIVRLKASDSGRFEVRDQNGNLAFVVELEVDEPAPDLYDDYDDLYRPSLFHSGGYIAIGVGAIITVAICCFCVRRCCCQKSSSKRDSSAPQTAAGPAEYYHDDTSQPSGPSYSTPPYVPGPSYSNPSNVTGPSYSPPPYVPMYTHEPTPLTAMEPESRSLEPLGYNTNVPASGGPSAAPSFSLGSDCLSSDPVPQFDLKGLSFPSAPPLSSDSTNSHVYTSDKLDFL